MEEIKLTETKISTEPQQTIPEKKLSIGVRILSILFIACGGILIFNFLSQTRRGYTEDVLFYIIGGAGMLIGGIGMLKRKYWALKLTQALVIMWGVVLCLAMTLSLTRRLGHGQINQGYSGFPLFALIFSIFFALPLWFFFKKSTVDQFKTSSEREAVLKAIRLKKEIKE